MLDNHKKSWTLLVGEERERERETERESKGMYVTLAKVANWEDSTKKGPLSNLLVHSVQFVTSPPPSRNN